MRPSMFTAEAEAQNGLEHGCTQVCAGVDGQRHGESWLATSAARRTAGWLETSASAPASPRSQLAVGASWASRTSASSFSMTSSTRARLSMKELTETRSIRLVVAL